MKRIVLFILIAGAIASSSLADEIYVVRANESLAQIAKEKGVSWRQLLTVNPEISDPTLVKTGQKIRIPEQEFFLWRNPGGNPFGNKNFAKAIRMFSLPDSVKEFFIFEVERENSEICRVRKGDFFRQMIFDNFRLAEKVVAAWPDSSISYQAKIYICRTDSLVYYLIAPVVCNNWAWREEVVKKEIIVREEKPKIKEKEAPPLVVEKEKKDESVFIRRDETYLWAGHYFPLKGAGGGNYYGGKSNFFFSTKGAFLGRFHFGIGGIANGWEGKSGSGFRYEGYRFSVGPILDMTRKTNRFTVSLQAGRQNDHGRDGLGYKAEQETSIIYFGLTADSYGSEEDIFQARKFETWLDFIFDVGHSKKSWWLSNRISRENDRPENKGSANFGSRWYFGTIDGFKTGLVMKSSYAYEDNGITSILGFVIGSKQDIAKLGFEFKNTSNSKFDDANGNSIGVTLDFEPTRRIIRGKL
jgi:LysM repeat protein